MLPPLCPEGFLPEAAARALSFLASRRPCGTSVVVWDNPVTRASQSGGGGLSLEPGGRGASSASLDSAMRWHGSVEGVTQAQAKL